MDTLPEILRKRTNSDGSTGSIKLPRPTETSCLVFGLQSSTFEWVEKNKLFDDNGQTKAGIQAAKIPMFGKDVKYTLKGAWSSEANIKSGKIRLPNRVRRQQTLGKRMYVSATC